MAAHGVRVGLGRAPLPKRSAFTFALLATVFDGAEITLVSYFIPSLTSTFHAGVPDFVRVLLYQNLASLVGGLFFGWFGDRYGRRWTLAAAVGLYGLGTVWAGVAPSLTVFTASRAVAGLGIGGEFGAAFAVFNEIWPGRNRGLMGAVVQDMFVAGQFVSTVIGGLSLSLLASGWRGGFLAIGAISLGIAAAIALRMPESPVWQEYDDARRSGRLAPELVPSRIPLLDLFKGGRAGNTVKSSLMTAGLFYGSYSLITYLPTVLFSVYRLPRAQGTEVLLWTYAAVGTGILFTGWLADRWGRRRSLVAVTLVALGGYLFYLILPRQAPVGPYWGWAIFWEVMAINVGMGGFGLLGVWLGEMYPTRLRASGENFSYYVGRGLGASLGPYLAILVTSQPLQAMGYGVVGVVAACAIALAMPETRGRGIRALE